MLHVGLGRITGEISGREYYESCMTDSDTPRGVPDGSDTCSNNKLTPRSVAVWRTDVPTFRSREFSEYNATRRAVVNAPRQ
jgi:hypothetical protein